MIQLCGLPFTHDEIIHGAICQKPPKLQTQFAAGLPGQVWQPYVDQIWLPFDRLRPGRSRHTATYLTACFIIKTCESKCKCPQ